VTLASERRTKVLEQEPGAQIALRHQGTEGTTKQILDGLQVADVSAPVAPPPFALLFFAMVAYTCRVVVEVIWM